ncbi:hypothetical protein RvY_02176 [Ramazzottius varieornatus]|uniref:Uncharacterized protein n=1 Tax=Ramazzottius varieornatus TaxID=947166 RepID=A0A1D1UTY6_RAMVA|nr:hypothetical protein RvY_02176 [Ramazzottius varieornatus]
MSYFYYISTNLMVNYVDFVNASGWTTRVANHLHDGVPTRATSQKKLLAFLSLQKVYVVLHNDLVTYNDTVD